MSDQSVLDLMSSGSPLLPRAVTTVARDIARQLAPAHDQGIAHGDVGPHTVMLTVAPDGEVTSATLVSPRPDQRPANWPVAPERGIGPVEPPEDVYALGQLLRALDGYVRPGGSQRAQPDPAMLADEATQRPTLRQFLATLSDVTAPTEPAVQTASPSHDLTPIAASAASESTRGRRTPVMVGLVGALLVAAAAGGTYWWLNRAGDEPETAQSASDRGERASGEQATGAQTPDAGDDATAEAPRETAVGQADATAAETTAAETSVSETIVADPTLADDAQSDDAERPTVRRSGTITIGVKLDQPGLGMQIGNEFTGMDTEIAKVVAERLGYSEDQISFREAVNAQRETMLDTGQVDMVVATYSITDSRKETVQFAGPYFVAGQDLLIRVDDDSITGPADLEGKTLCSVTGATPAEKVNEEYPGTQLQERATYAECVEHVADGTLDALTTDDAILAGFAAQDYYAGRLRVVGQPFTTELYGIGLAKGDDRCEEINGIITQMWQDGTMQEIMSDHLSAARYRPNPDTNPPMVGGYCG